MSVTLREVIEYCGYNIETPEDAKWLLATQSEYEDLIELAEEVVEESENHIETQRNIVAGEDDEDR